MTDRDIIGMRTKTRKPAKSFSTVSIGRLLRRFGWIPKSSVQPAGGIKQAGGNHCVPGGLARDKRRPV
jgi:hypothetical protein